jgi:hypothetical protein
MDPRNRKILKEVPNTEQAKPENADRFRTRAQRQAANQDRHWLEIFNQEITSVLGPDLGQSRLRRPSSLFFP